jgi:hypothetical protein
MKKNYIGLFIFVLLIAGCKENSQSPQSADVIMPLAVGNQWYWDVEYYAPDGTVTGAHEMLVVSRDMSSGPERKYIMKGALLLRL